MTSSSRSFNRRLQGYANSHSLTLTVTTVTEATTSSSLSYNDHQHFFIMIALSTYILVHLFGLFTGITHKGIFRLFTNIVFHVGSLYDFGFGLGRVPHQHSSTLPIRRDLFPNIIHDSNFANPLHRISLQLVDNECFETLVDFSPPVEVSIEDLASITYIDYKT